MKQWLHWKYLQFKAVIGQPVPLSEQTYKALEARGYQRDVRVVLADMQADGHRYKVSELDLILDKSVYAQDINKRIEIEQELYRAGLLDIEDLSDAD